MNPIDLKALELIEDGQDRTADLALALRLTPREMIAILDRLERRGLIEPDPAEYVELTDKGRRKVLFSPKI